MRTKTSAIFSLLICIVLAAVLVCLLIMRSGKTREPAPDALDSVDIQPVLARVDARPEQETEPGAQDGTEPGAQGGTEPAPGTEPAVPAADAPRDDPTVPEQPEPAPEGYFADAAFLGSSVVTGLSMYDYDGVLDGSTFYAANSVTILGISTYLDQMQGHTYGKVYIGLGTNEMSYDKDELRTRFVDAIDRLRSFNPDCVIYLMSVPPVSQYKSNTSSSFTKLLVLQFNQMLYEIARDQDVWYLDVYSALCDENGYLPSDVTADGVHFSASHYQYWFDLLRTHYIL